MQQFPLAPSTIEADRPREGRDRLEYGVLVTLIAAIVVLAVLALGVSSSTLFDEPCDTPSETSSSCQAPGTLDPIRP